MVVTQTPRSPWLPLFGGIAISILGVVSTYLIPGSRMAGLTPLTFAQCVAVFGGIGLMVYALALTEGTRAEQDAKIRYGARFFLLGGALYALLAWLNVPFALMVAGFLAARLVEPFRRMLVWLGRS